MSEFPGPVPEFPNISIDNFLEEKGNYSSTCFFLTHCHSDHMRGIEEIVPFLRKHGYYLYCSPFSRMILLNSNYGFEEDEIKELEGTELIEVPGNEKNPGSYSITVTAIPAGHCAGSVMFLLQDSKKTVLFTGDFRIMKEELPTFVQLEDYMNGSLKLDKLYYDGTFSKEIYKEFPSRSESAQHAIDIIRKEFEENSEIHVDITSGAQLGYEDLLAKLAEEFNCKIHVDHDYFQKYSQLPTNNNILTENQNETRIHYYESAKKTRNVESKIPKPYFELRLSALKFKWNESVRPEFQKRVGNKYNVCYPTHSSLSELRFFLDCVGHYARQDITSKSQCDPTH